MAEESVKFCSAERLAFVEIFGIEGFNPHIAVLDIGVDVCSMINVVVPKYVKRCFHCWLILIYRYLESATIGHLQAVAVRDMPRESTCMGTTRLHFRRSMFLSGLKKYGWVSSADIFSIAMINVSSQRSSTLFAGDGSLLPISLDSAR